ncbi:MAG: type II secretion system F family protein [Candidatus Omnitrophica bacterium]|nr:type II secretion system F family protein [Candidatus Omnitrophota bacterium]
MKKYFYVAKTKDGKKIKGIEEANSKEELLNKIHAKGYFIISVEEQPVKIEKKSIFSLFQYKGKRKSVKLYDLALFARNLTTTLSSGLTLLRSLEIIAIQTESLKLEKALTASATYIKEGLSFSEALKKFSNIFPQLWVGIVEVGESSGNLPFVMEKLADYLEVRMEFERKIKTALVYPTIILIAAIIAVFVFLRFILPKFIVIFEQFDIELPFLTQIIFGIAKIFKKPLLFGIIVGGLILGIVLLMRSFRNPQTKKFWDKFILKFPIIRDLVFIECLERFSSSVAILLESGLPLVLTLEIAAYSTNNSFLEKELLYVRDKVRDGGSLSNELNRQKIFPLLISEMAKIGEETGTLPNVFNRVSLHYQKELSTKIDRLISAFEPLLIIIIGIIIGIIVISLFLPLFRLSTLAGGKGISL